MHLIRIVLLFTGLISLFMVVSGQNTERLTLTAKGHYGFITPHHKTITYYIEDHIPGIELAVARITDGSKMWHHIYRQPETGFTFYHTGLGNDEVFGKSTSLSMYIRNPLLKNPGRVNLYNKFDFGLAWVSNTFDLYENHTNLSISTHLNAFLRYTFDVEIEATPEWKLISGFSFGHISNGNVRDPNQGLNFVTASLGARYKFQSGDEEYKQQPPQDGFNEKTMPSHFTLIVSGGTKQISRRWDGNYFCSTLNFEYTPIVTRRFSYGAGLDFVYDGSMEDQALLDDNPYGKDDKYRAAFHLSTAVLVGNTSFIVQPGMYLWNDYTYFKKVSNRLGLRHQLDEHWLVNVSVRIHWAAVADFVEWGIGYRW